MVNTPLQTHGRPCLVIPLMQSGAVSHYHWMNGAQVLNAVALGTSPPVRWSRPSPSSATPRNRGLAGTAGLGTLAPSTGATAGARVDIEARHEVLGASHEVRLLPRF